MGNLREQIQRFALVSFPDSKTPDKSHLTRFFAGNLQKPGFNPTLWADRHCADGESHRRHGPATQGAGVGF
jgi:hypothetical protein